MDAMHFQGDHMLMHACVTQVHGTQTVHKRSQGCIGHQQNRQCDKEEVSKGVCVNRKGMIGLDVFGQATLWFELRFHVSVLPGRPGM